MTKSSKQKPLPGEADQAAAERRRAVALELAIKAAPFLLPTGHDKVRGAQLTAEAEHIEKWLKDAKP